MGGVHTCESMCACILTVCGSEEVEVSTRSVIASEVGRTHLTMQGWHCSTHFARDVVRGASGH